MLDFLHKHVVLLDAVMQSLHLGLFLFHVYNPVLFFCFYFSINVVIQSLLLLCMPSLNSFDNHLFFLSFSKPPLIFWCI